MKRDILKLAVPSIISNIAVPLLGIVDLILVGHLGSDVYIGAIALGGTIFSFLYWGFSFLRMGTGGITAQAFGRKSKKDMSVILFQGLIISIFCGVALVVFQTPLSYLSFYVIDGTPEVEKLANQYFMIRIWAAPATISMYVLTGWFIGMQNTRIPMMISIFLNVANIILNYVFVYFMHMKADGVALGTLIAQYLALILSVILMRRKFSSFIEIPSLKSILEYNKLKEFFSVNKDIFIRTISLIFVLSFFTVKSAEVDNSTLAVNTLLFQFFLIFSFFTDGLANAAESLTGKFYGQQDKLKLKNVIKQIFVFSLYTTIAFTVIYYLFSDDILNLLTDDSVVLNSSKPYLFWIVLIPSVSVISFIWDGVFMGVTKSAALRNSVLLSLIFIFLPSYYMLKGTYGNHGLWLSFSLFMLFRSGLLTYYAKKYSLV